MKITITNSEVKALIKCLDSLASNGINFSPKVWYFLSRNKSILNKINGEIEEARVNIAKKFLEEGDKAVSEDKRDAFQAEYNELLLIEREVEFMQLRFATIEAEMDKINGVPHIYVFFDYLVEDMEEKAKTEEDKQTEIVPA